MSDEHDSTHDTLSAQGLAEVSEVFDDLETLLKNPDVVGQLAERGLNASLALVAVEGMRSYLAGRKAEAAEDLRTVAEEIESRLAFGREDPPVEA